MLKEKLLEGLLQAPLTLVTVRSPEDIAQVDELLPYSIGFEIECDIRGGLTVKDHEAIFKSIPDIMEVHNDSGEQRYRIPNGMRGIVCLYTISQQLKYNSLLNPLSGIHYHVDCTECNSTDLLEVARIYEKWILEQLSTWGYKGNYNIKGLGFSLDNSGSWLRYNDLNTLEFRIGEMTFDYNLLLKRILHVTQIVKKIKDQLSFTHPVRYTRPSWKEIFAYHKSMNSRLTDLQKKLYILNNDVNKISEQEAKERPVDPMGEIRNQVRNRSHRINGD